MNNPHIFTATLRAGGVHDWQGEEGSTEATNLVAILDAQVEATLALAYEQGTANLIAMLQAGYTSVQVNGVDYEKLADQIKERLGL